jgi:hypothetical protein
MRALLRPVGSGRGQQEDSSMSYRRRHRWFPRLALALAAASVIFVGRASVAAAKVDEGTSAAQQIQVIPYLSHGILTQADADVAAAAAQPQKPRLNPDISLWMARDYSAFQHARQTPYLSLGMSTYGDSRELPEPFVDDKVNVPVRPDDLGDRFTPSDVPSQVEPTNGDNWRLEWSDAVPLGLGIIVLGIALGLALGHLRRPRLASL